MLLHTLAKQLPRHIFKRTVRPEKAWWPVDSDPKEDAKAVGTRRSPADEPPPRQGNKKLDEPASKLESVGNIYIYIYIYHLYISIHPSIYQYL